MYYIACLGPNRKIVRQKFTDHTAELEAFACAYDKAPNTGVFDCVSTLKSIGGKYDRRRPNLESIQIIHADVDPRDLMVSGREEVHAKLLTLPAEVELRDSGYGYHPVIRLRDPVMADTVALDRTDELRTRMTTVVTGDRAVDHNVSLLRRVGTYNRKHSEPKLCRILRPAAPISLEEAGNLIEALGVNPWFSRGPIDPVLNRARVERAAGELDPDELLGKMSYQGAHPINLTQHRAIKALLHDGVCLLRTVQIVLAATRSAVRGDPRCAAWDWRQEQEQIADMAHRCINHYPKLHPLLEPAHLVGWQSRVAAGKTPQLIRHRGIGWVVGDAPEPPPKMTSIDDWPQQIIADTRLTGCAIRHAYRNVLPALRADGYYPMRPELAGNAIQEPRRTVERAHSLLVTCGHLHRVAYTDDGRIPCYAPVGSTPKMASTEEIERREDTKKGETIASQLQEKENDND